MISIILANNCSNFVRSQCYSTKITKLFVFLKNGQNLSSIRGNYFGRNTENICDLAIIKRNVRPIK